MNVLLVYSNVVGVTPHYLDVLLILAVGSCGGRLRMLPLFITLQQLHEVKCFIDPYKGIWAYRTLSWCSSGATGLLLIIWSYDCFAVRVAIWRGDTIEIDILFFEVFLFVFEWSDFFVLFTSAVVIWIFNIGLLSRQGQILTRIIIQPTLNSKSKINFVS